MASKKPSKTASKTGKTPRAGAKKKQFAADELFKVSVKHDPKSKKFAFKITTANGTHGFDKSVNETMKFVDLINKKHGKKALKSIQSKNKDLKGNTKQQLTYMKEWMSIVGKHKEVATDKSIHDWMGASGDVLNDLKSGGSSKKSSKASNTGNDDSKQNDSHPSSSSSGANSAEVTQLRQKYQEAQRAIEQLKAEKDAIMRQAQQKEAELRSQLAQSMQEYEQLEAKYDALQETWEENQDQIKSLENVLNKQDYKDLENKFPHLAEQFGGYKDPEETIEILKEELDKKEQEIRDLREANLQYITENEQLKLQANRAEFTTSQALGALDEATNKESYAALMNDYREAEAEIDDLEKANELFKKQLDENTAKITKLEKKISQDEPLVAEYPELKQRIEKLTNDKAKFDAKLEISEKRSKGYQQSYEELRKEFAGMVSKEKMEETVKKAGKEKAEIEGEKKEIEKKMEKMQQELNVTKGELSDLKGEYDSLNTKYEKLEAGGAKDVNSELTLDLMYGFSLFKQNEFEFGSNISREQLKLWAEHVKKLTSEIHEEFVAEIEDLSKRNDLLEEYIEANGLPSPEDSGFNGLSSNSNEINDLPHPVPSMTIEDLDNYSPTKNQLREYIDLMFTEWRNDDNEALELLGTNISKEDLALVRELNKLGGKTLEEMKEDSSERVVDDAGGVGGMNDVIPEDASDEVKALIAKKNKAIAQLNEALLETEEKEHEMDGKYREQIAQLEEELQNAKEAVKRFKEKQQESGAMGIADAGMSDSEPDMGPSVPSIIAAQRDFQSVSGLDGTDSEHGPREDGSEAGDSQNGAEPFEVFGNIGNENGQGVDGSDNETPAVVNANSKMEELEREKAELVEYSHKLEDDIKQMVFDYDLKLSALQREHAHDIEAFELQLQAANEKVVDAAALQDNDFATNFNDRLQECWEIRDGETTLKLRHIEEIRELERTRDSLLRECHSLRIKNERYEQNVDERVRKLEEEKEKLERENEHFSLIASSVSDMKEEMDRLQAGRDLLEQQMQEFEEEKRALNNQLKENENKWKQEVNTHKHRATTAEQDLKNYVLKVHSGIVDPNDDELNSKILIGAEAEQMKDELVRKDRQLAEAIKSKIKLIQTSSYEIDRLRDEIRLFSTDPESRRNLQKYDLVPNAFNEAFDKRNKLRYRRGLRRLQHGSFGLSGQIVDDYEKKQLRDGLRAGNHDYDDRSSMADEDAQSHFSIFSEVPVGTYQDLLNNGAAGAEDEPTTTLGRAYSYTVGVLGTIGSGITGALGIEVTRKSEDANNPNNASNVNLNNANNLNGMHGMNASMMNLPNGNPAMMAAQSSMANAALMGSMYGAGSMDPATAAMHQRLMSANMSAYSGMQGNAQHMQRASRVSGMSFGGMPAGSVYSGMQGGVVPVGTHNHSQSQLSDFARNAAQGGVIDPVNRSMYNIAQVFDQTRFAMKSMDASEDASPDVGDDGMNGMNKQQRGGFTKLGVRPQRHARLRSRETKLSIADIAEHNEREENDTVDDLNANVSNVDISQPIPQKIRKKTHSRTLSTMVSHYGRAMDQLANDLNDNMADNLETMDNMGDMENIDLDSNDGGIGGNKINIADINAASYDINPIENHNSNDKTKQNNLRQQSQQFYNEAWAHDEEDDLLRSRSSSGGNGHNNGGGGPLNFDNISISNSENDEFKPDDL